MWRTDRYSAGKGAGMGSCLLLFLIAAGQPLLAQPTDAHAEKLLAKAATAMRHANTLSANFIQIDSHDGQTVRVTGSMKLRKPGRILYKSSLGDDSLYSDGKKLWRVSGSQDPIVAKATPDGSSFTNYFPNCEVVPLFFGQDCLNIRYAVRKRSLGKQAVAGVMCDVVEIKMASQDEARKPFTFVTQLAFGPDGVIRRLTSDMPLKNIVFHHSLVLSNVQINAPLQAAQFSYVPAAKKSDVPLDELVAKMIPVGHSAPAFSLPNPRGGSIALKDALRGKKALLLNFWSAGCSGCVAELPHLQKMFEELKGKGLEVITVNCWESRKEVAGYLWEHHLTMPTVLGGNEGVPNGDLAERYGIKAYPGNFIIDPAGKVLWRGAGFNEPQIRSVLEKAGIK